MKRSGKIITAVVLTLGIAGGAAAIGKHRFGDPVKRANYMVSYIGDELELDTIQLQSLTALKDQLIAARESVHSDMSNTHAQAAALINADQFDQGRALELLTEKTSSLNSVAPEVIGALGNFLDGLNPAQKAEIAKFMAEHKESHHGRHHWGRTSSPRYDSDSNDQ